MKEQDSSFEVITASCSRAPGTEHTGPDSSPWQRLYTQAGLLLLRELSAFTSMQEQCWNKTLSLFTVLSPCLQSVVLIVQSLQLIKCIVKLLLEKKSLHMGSSYFPRQKHLIFFNILPPCTREQKSMFRIYRKELMQDLLVFKRHNFLLLNICVFICVLKANKGEKSPPLPFSTLD